MVDIRRAIVRGISLALATALVCVWSARSDEGSEPLFAQGRPRPGRSMAMKIEDPSLRMRGPDALGRAGDYLLMNEKAAFIIEGLEQINSYYYYGGILIDAVTLEAGKQANPEQFEELGFFLGELDQMNLAEVGIRAFKGERIEILNDGDDGNDAVVRVRGTDDIFWIAELTLMGAVYSGLGVPKKLTHPFGFDLYVDYILPPDSRVMRIEFNIKNREQKPRKIFTAAGGFFGDATMSRYFSDSRRDVIGFEFEGGMPFLVASSGQGAWAFAIEGADMATANLSGFDAIIDANHLKRRIRLAPAGQAGDSAVVTHYFAVGDTDFNSALRHLNRANPRPLEGWNMVLTPLAGAVRDPAGAPVSMVLVEIEMENKKGEWKFVDGFFTDENGEFGGMIPDLGRELRLVAHLEGRPDPAPVYFNPGERSNIEVVIGDGGVLAYEVVDGDGRGLPARIVLFCGGEAVRTLYSVTGVGEDVVEPGEYEVSVLRGYEYIPYEGRLEIEPGKRTELKAALIHAVNTDGFLGADMHIHAGPSGDNKITIAERIVTVAAEGLEVAVATDHEAIISWRPGVEETGLGDWVATVLGQEVTASIPEHINMFPAETRYDLDARGGPVKWMGLDIDQIYAAIRERGAEIVQLNHPKGYMEMIDYDRKAGRPRLKHPDYLGLDPQAELWSWNFDSIELQNGCERVFDRLLPKRRGIFEDWMSFINLGHRITAVANSDAHDWRPPGSPRNYFPSSTDLPAEFRVEELVAAIKNGRALTSTGAFARVELGGAGMGDTLVVNGKTAELWVHIESIPQIDITHFKVFVNCDQVANVKVSPTEEVVKYDGRLDLTFTKDSQVVVMGFGKKRLPRGMTQFDPLGVPRFTSNPIYVDLGGDGWEPPGFDRCAYTLP